MKSNFNKKEQNNSEKTKKEILDNLLKKLLGPKISKLEKNNSTEAKNIRELSNTSQNLILSLESLSNNVRKQVYKNRQKLINNTNKLPKKMKLPIQKIGIKNLMNPKATPKQKRAGSKSFNKYKAPQTGRNTESNKSGYDKTNPRNVKNINNNTNERRTISPFITTREREDLSKKLYNNNFNKNRKTPFKIKKEKEKDNISTNNKEKAKIKKQSETNTKQKINNANNNINIINKNERSDSNLAEKNDNNNSNNTQILSNFPNLLLTNPTIKIDDNLVKDSLLVKSDINGEKEINIDDLISGPVYEEIIIDEKIFNNDNNKNKSNEENKNEIDKNKTKKELNSSVALYNKLKRSKITFLEGEHDFDLIFKDEKIEDFDIASNLNKNTDTNLTEISEHIPLEEKFETNLDFIMGYLDDKDIYNLMLVNKECFKTVINALISKTEISIDILQEEINKLKENNPDILFDNITKRKFLLSDNSLRAISLLNSSSGNNILKLNSNEIKKDEIILIYSLYFIATGKKSKIFVLNDNDKISYMQNYFKSNISKNNFGKFIEGELKGKIFDDKEIYHLYKMSKKYLDIISPNYFQKINKDIAIFVFVIKDILEQLGILEINGIEPDTEFILLNAKLQTKKAILNELNQIEENI